MNKQEFVEKLREHGAWCTECHDINGKKDRYVKSAKVRELLEQLDEPQAEKVEVSQEFADWVEKVMMWKRNSSWAVKEIAGYGWGAYMHDPEAGDELLPKKYPWVKAVQNNKEKHIKAIYDGYTVKPKQWVVKNDRGYVAMENFKDFKNQRVGVKLTITGEKSESLAWDDVDLEKAEAVATLVEGSVEEV